MRNTMARVCMIAYSEYPYDTRIRREAEALVHRGDFVESISLQFDLPGLSRELNGVVIHPLRIRRYRGSSTLRYILSYLRFFAAALLRVAAEHLRCRFDIIQIHTMPDFMVFSALLPRLMGARVIIDVHDLMPELFMSKFHVPFDHWLVRAIRFSEKCSIRFAHAAIAVSGPHLKALVSHGNPPEKFIVLMNSPDPIVFTRTSRTTGGGVHFKLAYHGDLSNRYNLDIAIRAAGLAFREIPDLRFSIIGEGEELGRLVMIVNEVKLNHVVDFSKKEFLFSEIPRMLADVDVGLVPLRNGVFTQYALPVKLLEYVELGIPVIATRSMAIEHYFGEDMIHYISGESEQELAESIVYLHRHPEVRAKMSHNARTRAQEISWDRQKLHYYSLIDSLLCPR